LRKLATTVSGLTANTKGFNPKEVVDAVASALSNIDVKLVAEIQSFFEVFHFKSFDTQIVAPVEVKKESPVKQRDPSPAPVAHAFDEVEDEEEDEAEEEVPQEETKAKDEEYSPEEIEEYDVEDDTKVTIKH
jgi:hypothetical protein